MRAALTFCLLGLLAACGTDEPDERQAIYAGDQDDTSSGSSDEDATAPDDDASAGDDTGEGSDPSSDDAGSSDTSAPDVEPPDSGDPGLDTGDSPWGGGVHPNPGFEAGESWVRDPFATWAHAWARTGDPIHESEAQFEALEGIAALKVWGSYSGSYPNQQLNVQEFTGAAEGDTVTVTGHLFSHPDDAISSGNTASVVAIAVDSAGGVLAEAAADLPTGAAGTWEELTATLTVPAGTSRVRAGLRFTQDSAETSGSVYADAFRTTSTGALTAVETRELVWQDEFDGVRDDGTGLDTSKWFRQMWPPYNVNNEQQGYFNREENAFVSDGLLTLRAIRGDVSSAEYSSGRIETDGLASWLYGRFEARIQVPTTRGTWPAFWMLPEAWAYGGWPDSGEIDIMEYVGCDPELVHATVHTGAYNHMNNTQRGESLNLPTANSEFHIYSADWTPERIVFHVNGTEIFRFDNDDAGNSSTWPFNQRYYMILNLAVGGFWGGYCGVDTSAWPQDVLVDWVRVYQSADEIQATNSLPRR